MVYVDYTNKNRTNSFQHDNYYYSPEKPSFVINGYEFSLSKDATSESELNIVETPMYTPRSMWGYKDIKFNNFTGEVFDCVIFSRTTDIYTGEHAQPEEEELGISDFYDSPRTPHAVLKYWSQNFVPCVVVTNLQAYNDGTYVIKELKQKNLEMDFVESTLTLIYYYKYKEQHNQVYWKPWSAGQFNNAKTLEMSTLAQEVLDLDFHSQMCGCTENTPYTECQSTSNPEVELIQRLLQNWGYFPTYSRITGKIVPNGVYCYQTTQAIMRFQEDEGIPVSGDFTEETRSRFLKRVTEGK